MVLRVFIQYLQLDISMWGKLRSQHAGVFSGLILITKMEQFATLVNAFSPLLIATKLSVLDLCGSSEYATVCDVIVKMWLALAAILIFQRLLRFS